MLGLARVFASMIGCLVLFASPAYSGTTPQVDVETRSSWASPGRPEAEVLLRNAGTRPVEFSMRLGRGKNGKRIVCDKDLRSLDPNFHRRFDDRIGISRIMTSGVIAAGGWAHRSYPVGAAGLVPPCVVPYIVGLADGTELEGVISIPGEEPAWGPTEVTENSVTAELGVEKDERFGPRVITRLLVRNRQKATALLRIEDRTLVCPTGLSASWALRDSVLPGQDVGPMLVEPGGWATFVDAIVLSDRSRSGECTVKFSLSAFGEKGFVPAGSFEFPLQQDGTYDVPLVHRK
jgi:hypothetical protein